MIERKYLGEGQGHIDLHILGDAPERNLFNETEARAARVIVDCLGCRADEVKRDAKLVDLGADSLDEVELVMFLEEEFGISIPDDKAHEATTVADLFALVSE